MEKIFSTESEGLDKQPSKKVLMSAVMTIKRFKSEGIVFRSVDMIKGIQKSMKSDDYSQNKLKQVLFVNFMVKGDVFLD